MKQLSDDTHNHLKALCEQGDDLVNEGDFVPAIAKYKEAFALLPEPQSDWEAATWIIAALADAHFFRGAWGDCRDVVQYALKNCPGALQNPFFHLRAGQAYFELGEIERAKQWLTSFADLLTLGVPEWPPWPRPDPDPTVLDLAAGGKILFDSPLS